MTAYEYKVVPAPKKGVRAKGKRGAEARFAHTLEMLMNELGADGWEYQRTDTLPCDSRSGLTGRSTAFQNMLVFRRVVEDPAVETVEAAPAPQFSRSEPVLAAPKERVPEPMIVPIEAPIEKHEKSEVAAE